MASSHPPISSSPLSASLLRLKLLDALRSGDTTKVDALMASLKSTKSTVQTKDIIHLRETILHYAVQVAPLAIIQYLVEHSNSLDLDINSQDQDGNTPLHLAAVSSRGEVVKYLLSLNNINDTTVNNDKKQPVELCKDLETAQLMQFERAKFVERLASQLREYFSKRDFNNLETLLVSNPRAAELLDINGSDPETGFTVLHEFIVKNDLQMCDWILKHGGDPFKRDKRGKLPIDLVHNKNDPIRKLLKVASKEQTIMDPVVPPSKTNNAPTYKGYLKKWTNFASGYKLRYFVLDDKGILSYYANQDDTNNAIRGSLNLGFGTLHLDSSEKMKFEIIGKNGIRWHLKANHPIETNRWVWTLQNAITLAKDRLKTRQSDVLNVDTNEPSSPIVATKQSFEDDVGQKRYLKNLGRRKHKRTGSSVSVNTVGSGIEDEATPNLSRNSTIRKDHVPQPVNAKVNIAENQSIEVTDNENFDYDLNDIQEGDFDSDSESFTRSHNDIIIRDELSTIRGSLDIEIASILDLFSNVIKTSESFDTEIFNVGLNTLKTIQGLFAQYNDLLQHKDANTAKKFERQLEVNKLWENSIHQLEKEIASREQKLAQYEGKQKKLKKILAKSGNNTPQSGSAVNVVQLEESTKAKDNLPAELSESVLEDILQDSDDEFFDANGLDEDLLSSELQSDDETMKDNPQRLDTKLFNTADEDPQISETTATESNGGGEKTSHEEFKPGLNEAQAKMATLIANEDSFLGYENPPRERLAMSEDNRPKLGLWSILRSMIGKDMTKMTLPVSFNECTSLLQRLAEDIEYSNLLDEAATFDDSALRTAYVAAFAASEYASTINRIAKPFNPLLGETFEYCRPDKNYRLVSEQVSHHPPVSACNVESIKWDYYGENAVDSQFRGRSFDFKHLGKMFCAIRPDNGVINSKGVKVDEELYSWKKVNTSVVGIMLGNPTVDNFGKMEVTNHTTGDKIIVDLKQRGWKASSAYQLNGYVVDRNGKQRWAIGGHWNSKIFGKKIIQDEPIDTSKSSSLVEASKNNMNGSRDPNSGGIFLIWQAAPRPKVPFNLTSFAITLNGIDDNLRSYLAPSDTRLRPDQRAMEDGEYDKASDEKWRLEEKQRAARKKRELTRQPYIPNWFVKKTHPITGDSYWEFEGKYWRQRRDKNLAGCADIF